MLPGRCMLLAAHAEEKAVKTQVKIMSIPEVTARLNSFSSNWYGARAVIEEELKAISKALERIRTSSQLQDELTEHLLAVHRQWCEACPPTQEPGHRGEGPLLEKEAPGPGPTSCAHSRVAAAASNPQQVSATVETAEIVNGPQRVGGEVDDNNDIDESSVPLSMTSHMEDEEVLSDVNRTLEKASAEKGVITTFIKVEALEDDQYPDILLKLEKDHSDVDVDSSTMETTSHQRHEEEEPSQHTESDGKFHLKLANTVSDQFQMKHEEDSQEYCDLDMDGNSSKATCNLGHQEEIPLDRSDGTNNSNSALNCDGLSPEGVSDDQFSVGLDSNKTDQRTLRSDGKIYQCSDCSKRYFSRYEYDKHLNKSTCQKPYQCSFCGRSFSKIKYFDKHLPCMKKPKKKRNEEKPYKCDLCSYQCSTKGTLNVHMSIHTGAYRCSSCGRCFHSEMDVEHHMTMVHSGRKCFECDRCSYSCAEESSLQDHMRKHTVKKHTREKLFKCDCCTFRSAYKQALINHMRTHSGEKPYSCDVCDYRCSQYGNLVQHRRIHAGQKPYQCSLCGKRFTQSSHLNTHMIIHTGQKPHKCSFCGKGFTQMAHCKKHMKTH